MKITSLKDAFIVLTLGLFVVLFFYGLDNALVPLTFSWFLAYASLPVVKKLEKWGLSREQSSVLVLTTVLIGFIILALIIVPPFIRDFHAALLDVPTNVSIALAKMDAFFSNYGFHVPYDRQSLVDFAHTYANKLSSTFVKSFGQIVTNSLVNAASIIVICMNLFLIPIFFIYLLNDYEKFIDTFEGFIPMAWRKQVDEFLTQCNSVLNGYIRGQLLVCAILATLYSLGLLLVGIKFAIIIGCMTGFLSIIPYVGFSLGLIAAFITALANFEGVGPLIGIGVVYSIIQVLESFVITPRIVGNKVGLSSFEAILALIILGNFLGFIGLFVAIPIGAISKLLICKLLDAYQSTSFYKAK